MFKTASFKVHNPSRHKAVALKHAMRRYHETLRQVVEGAVVDTGLEAVITAADPETGRPRLNKALLGRYIYEHTPKGLPISPLRDYIVSDAMAMLLSYYAKRLKGDLQARPPTLPSLEALSEDEIRLSMKEFTERIEWPVKSQQAGRIDEAREQNHPRVTRRLEAIYKSWAASKAAGAMLRQTEATKPHPVQFERSEFSRGFLLARCGNRFCCLVRLFSSDSKYARECVLAPGFVDVRTGELLEGRTYPGLVLPLELGRDYHEREFILHGRPQSAKLILRPDQNGAESFHLNISFEFTPAPVQTETFLGIDRGAAMIGAATVIDGRGGVLERKHLEGAAFAGEMRRYEAAIAGAQRKGRRRFNFRLRGRRADIIVNEYANALTRLAVKHKSQIVVEKLDARSMALFLKRSQVQKLYSALAYKAEREGLPGPAEVPAAFTSQTCPRCGHRARENRPRADARGEPLQNVFRCINCGYEANADENASEIIALRGLHQLTFGKGRFQKFDIFQVWLKGQRSGASAAD